MWRWWESGKNSTIYLNNIQMWFRFKLIQNQGWVQKPLFCKIKVLSSVRINTKQPVNTGFRFRFDSAPWIKLYQDLWTQSLILSINLDWKSVQYIVLEIFHAFLFKNFSFFITAHLINTGNYHTVLHLLICADYFIPEVYVNQYHDILT